MIKETFSFILNLRFHRKESKHLNKGPYASLTLWVLIGSIPTGLIGLAFRPFLEALFHSVTMTGFMLLFTGIILAATRMISKDYNRRKEVGLLTALAVGIAQGIAIIPGISRSGATIACGMICKMERDLAARYSFLLAIPAIIGALGLQLSAGELGNVGLFPLLSGFLSSILVGLIALKILMGMVRRGGLFYFAPYCCALGLLIIKIS